MSRMGRLFTMEHNIQSDLGQEVKQNAEVSTTTSDGKRLNDHQSEMVAYILSGKNRRKIFAYITSQPSYGYKIAKDLEIHPTSVIRTLNDLKSMNIIRCMNPLSHRWKFYTLTTDAEKVKDLILSMCAESSIISEI